MTSGRHCLSTPAGVCAPPATLPDRGWIEATVPGTAAGARRAAGLDPSGDHHAQDHWFALDCQLPPLARLECEGLAILPEVWLDGTLVAGSKACSGSCGLRCRQLARSAFLVRPGLVMPGLVMPGLVMPGAAATAEVPPPGTTRRATQQGGSGHLQLRLPGGAGRGGMPHAAGQATPLAAKREDLVGTIWARSASAWKATTSEADRAAALRGN
jgi:hypothetical protein